MFKNFILFQIITVLLSCNNGNEVIESKNQYNLIDSQDLFLNDSFVQDIPSQTSLLHPVHHLSR